MSVPYCSHSGNGLDSSLCKIELTGFDLGCHHGCVFMKKTEEESGKAILLDIKKEMAKPRKAKSAREWEVKLAAAR